MATTLIGDRLVQATGGRRYRFVIMTYHGDWHIFEAIRAIVGEATGLECIRADDILASGEDLRLKIHSAIDYSTFVIAEVSDPRPNVYYELGYAVARNKEALLLAQERAHIPTDILGLEIVRYSTTADGWKQFQETLRRHLVAQTSLVQVSLLRSMIIPRQPTPAYILASPKPPTSLSRFQSPFERRTYGDHLGILGILRSFGSVYGEHVAPELISAERVDESLLREDASFYVIGSPKSNAVTRSLLEEMQRGRAPSWIFQPAPGEEATGDYEVILTGELDKAIFVSNDRRYLPHDPPVDDCGLIVRGPNPRFPQRLAMILAGPHARGTGAACLAATNSSLIRQITEKLPNGMSDLADHDRTLWALVHVVPDRDLHISSDGVSITAAGVYA